MTIQVVGRLPSAPAPLVNGASKLSPPYGRVSPIAGESLDLSAIMRAERIIDIYWDRHLDRFSVTLSDYSSGQGGTVGEALADAHRRVA